MEAVAALIVFFLYVFWQLRIKISKSNLKNTKTGRNQTWLITCKGEVGRVSFENNHFE